MPKRVAIIGCSQNSFGQYSDSLESLIFFTARAALEDASLELKQVDGVVTACSDQVDGRAISSMITTGPAGGHLKDEINLASSGAHALIMAYLSIASGQHEVVLVSSWGKASEGELAIAEHLTTDPYFDRDLPLTHLSAMAMQAQAFRSCVPGASEAARSVVVKNRANGASKTHRLHSSVTDQEVLTSPLVATPLRHLEIAPECDGSYSLVLAARSGVRDGTRAVTVQGVGWAADGYRLSERDLVALPHLRTATEAASKRAGIASVAQEVDFFELHDYCADAELLACAAIGLCPIDGVAEFVRSGNTGPAGPKPVNVSGGSISGEAPFGGVLNKVVESVHLIRADAEGRTAKKAARGLVQMSAGFAGQLQTVLILGPDEGGAD